ncbi:MAG: hypothetical protein AB7O68_20690 [Pirellulales bacterium]
MSGGRLPALSRWRVAAIVWASPASTLGLLIGALALLTGGRLQRVGRTLEFWGGLLPWCLSRVPIGGAAAALTLGHVIIGQNQAALTMSRAHEWIHVRQYERWGPLFLPAYFACSAWLWVTGRHPYLDNPFEREAYERSD